MEVSLSADRGAKVLLSGPSGSGKSTLLSLIGGLDRARTGRLEVAGLDLRRARGAAMARFRGWTAGFVFQHHFLPPGLAAREAVAAPLLWVKGETPGRALRRAEELLDGLGFTREEVRRPVERLSGGQRQRVAFARAIAPEPELLLADEPTAQLDDETASKLLEALLRWAAVDGRTLLLAAYQHYQEFEGEFRIVRLEKGRIAVDSGAPPTR